MDVEDVPWTYVAETITTPWTVFPVNIVHYMEQEGLPHLVCRHNTPEAATRAVSGYIRSLTSDQEHGFTTLFDPCLIDACCGQGVFPMSLFATSEVFFFSPKLHQHRMVLNLDDFKPKRSAVKRAKKYTVSVNDQFGAAMKRVAELKGENWMCSPLRKAFAYMHNNSDKYRTKMLSISIWDEDGNMAASEVGYSIAGIYTSLSGTTTESGVGSVQLCALGCILKSCGFSHWDFGMEMQYKVDLGAEQFPRQAWLQFVKQRCARYPAGQGEPVFNLPQPRMPCADVIAAAFPKTPVEQPCADEDKRRAKLEKKELKRRKGAQWREEHGVDHSVAATPAAAAPAATGKAKRAGAAVQEPKKPAAQESSTSLSPRNSSPTATTAIHHDVACGDDEGDCGLLWHMAGRTCDRTTHRLTAETLLGSPMSLDNSAVPISYDPMPAKKPRRISE